MFRYIFVGQTLPGRATSLRITLFHPLGTGRSSSTFLKETILMKLARALPPLFAILAALFSAPAAKAECWDYWDWGAVDCTGSGGCESQWEDITCGIGCVSGSCNSTGNSTECCGTRHDYAAGVDDGQDSCHGVGCGGSPGRHHIRGPRAQSQHRAELLQGYTPGLVMISADLSYKEPQLIYVLNRCNRTYEAVADGGKVLPGGGI